MSYICDQHGWMSHYEMCPVCRSSMTRTSANIMWNPNFFESDHEVIHEEKVKTTGFKKEKLQAIQAKITKAEALIEELAGALARVSSLGFVHYIDCATLDSDDENIRCDCGVNVCEGLLEQALAAYKKWKEGE